ncbi:uncharacterized protein LOC141531137 [Cotesia typhae]|uniref:uncharacterized protein LOC141531137 n=1 Tax=Cotesia typhae TaxID=2053667 RepID=UPI003D69C12C
MISVPILFCLIASVLAQSADQGSFPTPQSHKPHKTPSNHQPPKLSSSIKPSDASSSNIKSSEPISSNIKPSSSNIKPPDPSSSSVETSDLSFPSNKPSPPTFSSIEPPKNTSSSHHNFKSPSSGPQPSKTSKCPFVRSLSYNLSAMCGEWYVYESSLNVRSKDERCIKVKLEEYPVGKFKLTSKSYITR